MTQWIFFGHQRDNKEDGLKMDYIWISDICLERSQGYNGSFLDTKGIIQKMDIKWIQFGTLIIV